MHIAKVPPGAPHASLGTPPGAEIRVHGSLQTSPEWVPEVSAARNGTIGNAHVEVGGRAPLVAGEHGNRRLPFVLGPSSISEADLGPVVQVHHHPTAGLVPAGGRDSVLQGPRSRSED